MRGAMNALRRLLLLLLPLVLALGAMPSSAAHLAAPGGAHAMSGMDMPAHAPAMPDHQAGNLCLANLCPGCVAPVTLGAPVLVPPSRAALPVGALPLPALAPPMALPPATPPPRLA
jgi:hypothetical protein